MATSPIHPRASSFTSLELVLELSSSINMVLDINRGLGGAVLMVDESEAMASRGRAVAVPSSISV